MTSPARRVLSTARRAMSLDWVTWRLISLMEARSCSAPAATDVTLADARPAEAAIVVACTSVPDATLVISVACCRNCADERFTVSTTAWTDC